MAGHHYRPGGHYVIDDRTGLKIRATDARLEWNGGLVHRNDWEPRHPQDFVRSRRDKQTVAVTRPERIDQFIGPLNTSLTSDAAAGDTVVSVVTSERFLAGDRVKLLLDNGDCFRAIVQSLPDSESIEISRPLTWAASAGLVLTNETATSPADIG
jgi:hypothetical protein